jgi:hypothetical protein
MMIEEEKQHVINVEEAVVAEGRANALSSESGPREMVGWDFISGHGSSILVFQIQKTMLQRFCSVVGIIFHTHDT